MKKMIATPEGTADRLFSRCAARRRVESRLTDLFAARGYSEIMTPEVEYYDLFFQTGNPMPQEAMMKIIDRSGSILVMRPDNTTPIARVAAAKLKSLPGPHRLYYNQTVFRSDNAHTAARSEIAQCGIELIGAQGIKADLEVIYLAVEALKRSGLKDFYIELGHAGFFKALVSGLEAEVQEIIRQQIESKNFAALNFYIKNNMNNQTGTVLKNLSRLFGGAEVLDQARELSNDPQAGQAIDYLRRLYDELSHAGCANRIRFDLGLVHQLDYYTGVVFRGYAEGAGGSIVAGGRYDNLIGRIGSDTPATGFAVDIDAVAGCLEQEPVRAPKTLVYYELGCLLQAAAYMDQSETNCQLSSAGTLEEAVWEARAKGICSVKVFESAGERTLEV